MRKNQDILQMQTPTVFSWEHILAYLCREPNEVMYQVLDQKIRRAFLVSEQIYLCELAFFSEKNSIEVTLLSDVVWTEESKIQIAEYISDWFDLKTDISSFYQMAKNDDLLNPLVDKFYGFRLVGVPDFYEAMTWGILGQQINLAYAYTLKRRFTETYGTEITYKGHSYWIYPDPKVIASLATEELQKLRLTQKKAEYLIDISQKLVSGEISKSYFLSFTDIKSIEKEMVKMRGIGPWTANYVIMRCFRINDAFPMADVGLLNGIKVIENQIEKPDKKKNGTIKMSMGSLGQLCYFLYLAITLLKGGKKCFIKKITSHL